jgi:hypothetical protein
MQFPNKFKLVLAAYCYHYHYKPSSKLCPNVLLEILPSTSRISKWTVSIFSNRNRLQTTPRYPADEDQMSLQSPAHPSPTRLNRSRHSHVQSLPQWKWETISALTQKGVKLYNFKNHALYKERKIQDPNRNRTQTLGVRTVSVGRSVNRTENVAPKIRHGNLMETTCKY